MAAKQAAIDRPRPSVLVTFVQAVFFTPLWLIVSLVFVVSFAGTAAMGCRNGDPA
jgi:hypothetical protein